MTPRLGQSRQEEARTRPPPSGRDVVPGVYRTCEGRVEAPKTIARRAAIEPSIRDAICGHAPRSTAESYEQVSVEDMAEALAEFPKYEV
jgi:hypothetical protein